MKIIKNAKLPEIEKNPPRTGSYVDLILFSSVVAVWVKIPQDQRMW